MMISNATLRLIWCIVISAKHYSSGTKINGHICKVNGVRFIKLIDRMGLMQKHCKNNCSASCYTILKSQYCKTRQLEKKLSLPTLIFPVLLLHKATKITQEGLKNSANLWCRNYWEVELTSLIFITMQPTYWPEQGQAVSNISLLMLWSIFALQILLGTFQLGSHELIWCFFFSMRQKNV